MGGMFLLAVVPIIALLVWLFSEGVRTLNQDALRTGRSYGLSFVNQLDDQLSAIRRWNQRTVNRDDVTALAMVPEVYGIYEKSAAIWTVKDSLAWLIDDNTFLRNVRVYLPAVGKVIAGAGTVDDLDADDYERRRARVAARPSNMRAFEADGELLIGYVYRRSSMPGWENHNFLFEYELDRAEIERELMRLRSGAVGYAFASIDGVAVGADAVLPADRMLSGELRDGDELRVGGEKYVLLTQGTSGVMLYLLLREGEMLLPVSQYMRLFYLLVLLGAVMAMGFAWYVYRAVYKPIRLLRLKFAEVAQGNLDVRIDARSRNEFGDLYRGFDDMTGKLNNLVNQVYRHRILTQRAELKQLQAQINPHFLYNSFFLLSRMIQRGQQAQAEAFCSQLGGYFQFLARGAEDQVPLSREVEHARAYANMQDLRFRSRILLRFDPLPERCATRMVPRLILQPVIENAYEHGLGEAEEGGRISVTFEEGERELTISVEDSGRTLSDAALTALRRALDEPSDDAEYTALRNIHRRLILSLGDAAGVRLARGESGGLRVSLHIPDEGRGVEA